MKPPPCTRTPAKLSPVSSAHEANEIVFTRGATSAFNTVAYGWGLRNLKEDDRVLLTIMEHHANIVPWQLISDLTGCNIEFVGITADGRLDLDDFYHLLDDDVKLVGVSLASNVLGTVNPIQEIAEAAHGVGALVVADGAQAVPHTKVDVYDTGSTGCVSRATRCSAQPESVFCGDVRNYLKRWSRPKAAEK